MQRKAGCFALTLRVPGVQVSCHALLLLPRDCTSGEPSFCVVQAHTAHGMGQAFTMRLEVKLCAGFGHVIDLVPHGRLSVCPSQLDVGFQLNWEFSAAL